MELEKEITELIEGKLPSLQANAFKKYVEESEENKTILANIKEILARANEKIRLLEKYESIESKQTSKEAELNQKEKELQRKQDVIEIETLRYQLQSEVRSKGDIFKLVETFVRNPRAIETMVHNEQIPVPNQYGGVSYYDKSETKTTEKTEFKD